MVNWTEHFRRELALERLALRAKLDDPRAAAARLNQLQYHKLKPEKASRLLTLALRHIREREQEQSSPQGEK